MKKYIALILAIAMLFSLTGCGLLVKKVEVTCTCPGCLAAAGGGAQEDSGVEYKKLEAGSKSGVDCSKLPSDKASVLKLYQDVANATKAAKNQEVEIIAEGAKIQVGSITVDETGKALSSALMGTANKLIDSFSPKPETYTCNFVDGKDTNGNKTGDGEPRTTLNTLPSWDKEYMCDLTDDQVAEATAEELSDGYWKIKIVLNEAQCTMTDPATTPDTPHAHCMGTVQSKDLLTDFGGNGTIYFADLAYRDSGIIAIVDPASGYLVQLHTDLFMYGDAKMDVKLMSIGKVTAGLEKTTFINTYNWSKIS